MVRRNDLLLVGPLILSKLHAMVPLIDVVSAREHYLTFEPPLLK